MPAFIFGDPGGNFRFIITCLFHALLLMVIYHAPLQAQERWKTYYISTNAYASYLGKDLSIRNTSDTSLSQKLRDFFQIRHRGIYQIFKLNKLAEGKIYDFLSAVFAERELFQQYNDQLSTLKELEDLSSHIDIHAVNYHLIELVKQNEGEAVVNVVWSVHGTVVHPTHDHIRKNINAVSYQIRLEEPMKILSGKILSVDRFDLYQ